MIVIAHEAGMVTDTPRGGKAPWVLRRTVGGPAYSRAAASRLTAVPPPPWARCLQCPARNDALNAPLAHAPGTSSKLRDCLSPWARLTTEPANSSGLVRGTLSAGTLRARGRGTGTRVERRATANQRLTEGLKPNGLRRATALSVSLSSPSPSGRGPATQRGLGPGG